MSVEALDIGILGPAFLAGLLVLTTHVPLGQEVLRRGIIFIDLAIAQIAGLGVIAAHSLGWEPHGWEVQLAASAAALLGAALLAWTEKRWASIQEALIGTAFILAATAGLLLLSHNPRGGEHLREILVGQILWTGYQDLIPVAAIYAGVLVMRYAIGPGSRALFYLLFAVAVTVSVQLVGIYLVFASLIVPALATRSARRNALALGYLTGATGYAGGLVLSAALDLPAGAVIVWTLAAVAPLFARLARA